MRARRAIVAGACAVAASGWLAAPALASRWSALTLAGTSALADISCGQSSFCAAVDHAGDVITFNGTKWSPLNRVEMAPNDYFDAISCPSSAFCAAVSAEGRAATYDAGRWGALTTLDTLAAFLDVSCPSVSFCMATANDGRSYVYDGTSWRAAGSVYGALNPVSCTSPTFCAAVNSGYTYLYTGSSWSQAAGNFNLASTVSCASVAFCIVGDGGDYLVYNGSGWSAPSQSTAATRTCIWIGSPALHPRSAWESTPLTAAHISTTAAAGVRLGPCHPV